MKILKAHVDWHHGFANHPSLKVLVDEIPSLEDYRFIQNNGLYLGVIPPFAEFFYYDKPGHGYGGAKFHIKMRDGSEKTLIGPWSSNSGSINEAFTTEVMEVSYTNVEEAYERGYTFAAGAMLVKSVIKEALPFVQKYQDPNIKLILNKGFYTFGIRGEVIGEKPGWYKAPHDKGPAHLIRQDTIENRVTENYLDSNQAQGLE